MSFWVIAVSHIVVMVFTICYIGSRFKVYENDWLLGLRKLQSYNVLSRVWPTDKGFASLKYSAVRHSLIPLALSALIWFANIALLNKAALFIAILYAWSIFPRYRMRNADYKEAEAGSQKMLQPVRSACFSVIICAIANFFIILICYGLRP